MLYITLTLLYTNLKDSYTSIKLPGLGKSDHHVVHLSPQYQTRHKLSQPIEIKTRCWNDKEVVERIRHMLDTTIWSVFITEDIDGNSQNNLGLHMIF